MKKLLALFTLVASACQHQAPPTVATSASPARPVVVPHSSLPSLFKATDTLTAPMRALVRRYDFGRLWQGGQKQWESPVLEGFFGPDHYRFELVLNEVLRQSQRPDLYRVRGKCHYRKNVRPFAGWLTIREITPLEPPYDEDDGSFRPAIRPDSVSPDSFEARSQRIFANVHSYQLRAELLLTEQPAANSGELRAEATLNFYIAPPGRLGYVEAPMRNSDGLWNQGIVLVRGVRRNVSTKQVKKFVVADRVFVAAPDVLTDFAIGDRFPDQINPKYAHLGWNKKWENEEWWADSPAPSLFSTGEPITSKQAP